MSVTSFSLTASSADGKDTASVRHHLYKHNDGATRWELQRLIIGYLKTVAIVLGGCAKLSRRTSSLGKSFRDVLTISTLGLLIVQICWTILKKKKLDQRCGRILFDAFIAHCVRVGANFNDFVERLLDERALTDCSGTGERCVHVETALASLHSCSARVPLPCLLEALGQMYLECKRCCYVLRGALRAVETVDDNVLTLAGLSSDLLKEKHLTTKSGRRKLCEHYKKALTSDLAAKRMKKDESVRTKLLRETLFKEMLAYQCVGFRNFHDLRGVFSCTEDGTGMGGACSGEDRLPCYTRWYEYCNGVANPGLWKSKHREPNSCPNIISTYNFFHV